MYRTRLTKEQLAYNILYHIERGAQPTIESIIKVLTAAEENLKNKAKSLDKGELKYYN